MLINWRWRCVQGRTRSFYALLSILLLRFPLWPLGFLMPVSGVISFAVSKGTSDAWALEGCTCHTLSAECHSTVSCAFTNRMLWVTRMTEHWNHTHRQWKCRAQNLASPQLWMRVRGTATLMYSFVCCVEGFNILLKNSLSCNYFFVCIFIHVLLSCLLYAFFRFEQEIDIFNVAFCACVCVL